MDLPDLKAKVKVDTSGVGEAEAKLAAFSATVKRELNQNSGLKEFEQQAGQAFVKFGDAGEVTSLRISSSTARTRGDLQALEARARTFADGLETDFKRGTTAVVKLDQDGSAALGRVGQQMQATSSAASQAGAGVGALAAGLPVLIVVVAALGLALSPVVFLLGAFAIGVTAAAGVITLGLGGILALGAGIALLANRVQASSQANVNAVAAQTQLTTATNAHQLAVQQLDTFQRNAKGHQLNAIQVQELGDLQKNVTKTTYDLALAQNAVAASAGTAVPPMKQFTDHVGTLLDKLGNQAAPLLGPILGLLSGIADGAAQVGSMVIAGFGDRLGPILDLTAQFARQVMAGFVQLGPVVSAFLDAFIAGGPPLANLFGMMTSVGIAAIAGLLTNLLKLSDWFLERLPTMGPIVASIMGGIGLALQAIASVAGVVVDWFTAHWPQIGAVVTTIGENIATMWAAIVVGWQFAQPALNLAIAGFHLLDPLIQYIRDHAAQLQPLLDAVGIALAAIGVIAALTTVTIVIFAAAVVLVIAGLVWLFGILERGVSFLMDNWGPAVKQSGDRMSQLGSTTHAVIAAIGDAFSGLGSTVQGILSAIGGWLGDFGRKQSAVGSQVQSVIAAIGDAFSGLGSAVSRALAGAEGAVQSLLNALGRVPGAAQAAMASIPGVAGATGALHAAGVPGFASGGYAVPGSVFRVGESGPETGYAVPGGGVAIVPDSGQSSGRSITVNVNGATLQPMDERTLVNLLRAYDTLHGG